jgi:phosphoenolpyruvate-protein phosphotransferase (PTS system enzyme I)
MKELRGLGAAGGIAVGPAFVFRRHAADTRAALPVDDPAAEIGRLRVALARVKQDLTETAKRLAPSVGTEDARLFEAQALMLDDPELAERAARLIRDRLWPAERAIIEAGEESAAPLAMLPDEYLRARVADVRDVAARVRAVLEGAPSHPLAGLAAPSVIVADELLPSDTVAADRRRVLGFVTEVGSATAHAAILARSLGIPSVVAVEGALSVIHPGDTVAVDGTRGIVLVNLDPAQVKFWREEGRREAERRSGLDALRALPAETTDGHRIELGANVGSLEDVQDGLRHGAESVGLFRTEFLFLERDAAPSEDEQFEVYRRAAAAMAGRPVIMRTLDVGGDKPLKWLGIPAESNPFLGLRGLRLSLRHEEVFLCQVRALLRAAIFGAIWIMLPMVADVSEVRAAKRLVRTAETQLSRRGTRHAAAPLGIMIETPSAAVLADTLFGEVDFFSVGTNDLLQYVLAADRTNAQVAALADPFHPAMLRLIAAVTRSERRATKWVGVCGELAGDPKAAVLLVGLGIDELSMTPSRLPEVKAAVRAISLESARALAARALGCATAAEVRDILGATVGPA